MTQSHGGGGRSGARSDAIESPLNRHARPGHSRQAVTAWEWRAGHALRHPPALTPSRFVRPRATMLATRAAAVRLFAAVNTVWIILKSGNLIVQKDFRIIRRNTIYPKVGIQKAYRFQDSPI